MPESTLLNNPILTASISLGGNTNNHDPSSYSSSSTDAFLAALESENFDPVQFINKQFPSERSLQGVENVVQRLDSMVTQIDRDVKSAIREQAMLGFTAKQDLDEAKKAMNELVDRIKVVEQKASQSEALVLEFCRNIKFLDLAKTNLTNTVTGFKRFVMLVSALEQLRRLAADRKYKEVSNLLAACEQLSRHFLELSKVVPKVQDLLHQKDLMIRDLKAQIFEDYDALTDPTEEHVRAEEIRAASHCVDVMPKSIRHEIVTRFCLKILEEYKNIFSPDGKVHTSTGTGGGESGGEMSGTEKNNNYSGLDNVERRYAWLRRTLKDCEDRYLDSGVFPSRWNVSCHLCEHFCHITRQQLVEVLGSTAHQTDPELLVRVLRKSIDFENDLGRRYQEPNKTGATGFRQHDRKHISELNDDDKNNLNNNDPNSPKSLSPTKSVDPILSKYPEVHDPNQSLNQEDDDDTYHFPRFRGIISECFEAYLGTWVRHEEANLRALIPANEEAQETELPQYDQSKLDDEDDGCNSESEDSRLVFPSAPSLFDAMRKTMMKCSSFNIHHTLWEIFGVFKTIIQVYCSTLEGRIQNKVSSSQQNGDGNISEDDLKIACAIIGTLEYVDATLPQLSDTMKEYISSDYHHQLDFDQEQEQIGTLTSMIYLDVLVVSVQKRLEPILQTISKIPWYQHGDSDTAIGNSINRAPNVIQHSPYIGEIQNVLHTQFSIIQRDLSKLHYRFFCDKHVQWFIPRFIQEVYRCKRINKSGAEQLLLDTSTLKAILLETPLAATNNKCSMPSAYSNYVLREISKVEFVFRVLSEEPAALERITLAQQQQQQGDVKSASSVSSTVVTGTNLNQNLSIREIEKILSLKASGNLFDDQSAVLLEQQATAAANAAAAAEEEARLRSQALSGQGGAGAAHLEHMGKQLASGAQTLGKNAQTLASEARKKIFGNMKFGQG